MTISPDKFSNRILERHGKMGRDACHIMAEAISAVDPYESVKSFVLDTQLVKNLEEASRVFLIGFGKASVPMAKAVIDIYGDRLSFANVITKDGKFTIENGYKGKLNVYIGGHPVPTSDSIGSTRRILSYFPKLTESDFVFIVISGGGSALFTDPLGGISLGDFQILTEALLFCGADIYEINTLRKHLDSVKGGRLASFLYPAKCFAFILSDVIGNQIDMIASGPTSPDPTTFADAYDVVQKYGLKAKLPESILTVLSKGMQGIISETLKTENLAKDRIQNAIVGSNMQAKIAAKTQAERLGYRSFIIIEPLTGSTEDAAEKILSTIRNYKVAKRNSEMHICLIFGGETTVKVIGGGRGGRNQDIALHLSRKIAEIPGVLCITLATDGEDGPTDAAGAVVDSDVFYEGNRKGLDIKSFIVNNNAYEFFDQLGGLIRIGATGTNVNDLMFVLFDQ